MLSSVNKLSWVVKGFLERNWDRTNPLLIAYSGGPDSKALLYAALEWGKSEIHVVHADHGWRKESQEEAVQLEREVKMLGLSFHTRRLPPSSSEEEARIFRLTYFRELQKKQGYQAVLLGHQADDLTETVLKRIFEGAHLTALTGMREVSFFDERHLLDQLSFMQKEGVFSDAKRTGEDDEKRLQNVFCYDEISHSVFDEKSLACFGMQLWRPLLSVSRSEINDWLKERGLVSLFDPTNQDLRYLRARMRSDLLPLLNKTFGKNITQNLLQLSERSYELNQYLKNKNQNRIKRGPFGVWIDGVNLPRLELRFLVQQELKISRALLESILDWIEQKVANRVVSSHIALDRGHLFLFKKQLPCFGQPVALPLSGRCRSGEWVVEDGESEMSKLGLDALWSGELSIPCPEGAILLALPPKGARWKEKIPAFLRRICPVILQNEIIVGNCFSVRYIKCSRWIKLKIEHK